MLRENASLFVLIIFFSRSPFSAFDDKLLPFEAVAGISNMHHYGECQWLERTLCI